MNLLFVILGLLLAVAGLVLLILKNNIPLPQNMSLKKYCCLTSMILVLGLLLTVAGFSFKIVPTGYTGVRIRFGQISETVVKNGFNTNIPFVEKIKLVNNKQQDFKVDDKTQIWGETKEKTPVYARKVSVTYNISPEKSSWIYTNVTDVDNLLNVELIASAIKSSMVELSVNEVTVRETIEALTKEKLTESLNEKYGEDVITVSKVVIVTMDFEDAYNEAIRQKSIAQQTNEKQAIENDTAIKKAQAEKEVSIAAAEAAAESKRIAAEAEANANEKISESLNENILRSKYYEKWDGKLPTVVGEGNSAIIGYPTAQ